METRIAPPAKFRRTSATLFTRRVSEYIFGAHSSIGFSSRVDGTAGGCDCVNNGGANAGKENLMKNNMKNNTNKFPNSHPLISGQVLLKFCVVLALALMSSSVQAVTLHPEAKKRLEKEGKLSSYSQSQIAAKSRGVCSPSEHPLRTPGMIKTLANSGRLDEMFKLSSSLTPIDTVKVLVILVDFSDNPYNAAVAPYVSRISATPEMFDSVLFSTGRLNPSGSMTEYYLENSYGKFLIEGVIAGWYRMPLTYKAYVGEDRGLQWPTSPNAQDLAWDAVSAASADVDFSQFDNYGPSGVPDGLIDGLFVIHAGTGYEESQLLDIHSHKWSLRTVRSLNGVSVRAYTMEPEESYFSNTISPIGVFCHEFGHVLGLPDLYDTDLSSEGLGSWSIMASGNYLGASRYPSHLDAWSKSRIGFTIPMRLTENQTDVSIPMAESSAVCYRLWLSGFQTQEYFLVENRQKVGFDSEIPNSGLLIYHIDESFSNNDHDTLSYLVALEQADGNNDLQLNVNNGDAGDVWPGSTNNPEFTDLSSPDSRTNGDNPAVTQVSVWNISPSAHVMTANLDVTYSRPYLELTSLDLQDSDGDSVYEAGETVEIFFEAINRWASGFNAYVRMTTTNTEITLKTDSVFLGTISGLNKITDNFGDPLVFSIPNSVTPRIDSIFLDFYSNFGESRNRVSFELEIGAPEILLVNYDPNGAHEEFYSGDLYNARTPHRVHTFNSQGHVTGAQLKNFKTVLWFYGDLQSTAPTATEIQALKEYLDSGGKNLLISGQQLAAYLTEIDSTFLHSYLRVRDGVRAFDKLFVGVDGSPLGDGVFRQNPLQVFGTGSANNSSGNDLLRSGRSIVPINGSTPEFVRRSGSVDTVYASTYRGNYRIAYFSFPFEAIQNDPDISLITREEILERVLQFFENLSTDVSPDQDITVLPQSFELAQNYPNPFNPTTTIKYIVRKSGSRGIPLIELIVYNVLGQEVRTLVSERQSTGEYSVAWDSRDNSGAQVASGVYFYRLKLGPQAQTKKMILLR
ncbi:MAG: M6 family metalloprotease domain-containing protein [candidate division Zixibacteria bacterium]|nr:M6 family metalloprotease domain-containing protein [candidate division Zixibacteria bacterium]